MISNDLIKDSATEQEREMIRNLIDSLPGEYFGDWGGDWPSTIKKLYEILKGIEDRLLDTVSAQINPDSPAVER